MKTNRRTKAASNPKKSKSLLTEALLQFPFKLLDRALLLKLR